MRIDPTQPARVDETPRCSYVNAEKLLDGSILRIQTPTPPHDDETPTCVVTAELMAPRALDDRLRFGDWLVRRGLIQRTDLFAALTCSRTNGFRLGDALVALALLERAQVEEEAQAFSTFVGWE